MVLHFQYHEIGHLRFYIRKQRQAEMGWVVPGFPGQCVIPEQVYFTLHLQSLTSLLLLHEASFASKQQLGNAFMRFVSWKAEILKSSSKAATPSDIMMTVVPGALSILEKMHAEGIRRGHTVSLSVG